MGVYDKSLKWKDNWTSILFLKKNFFFVFSSWFIRLRLAKVMLKVKKLNQKVCKSVFFENKTVLNSTKESHDEGKWRANSH